MHLPAGAAITATILAANAVPFTASISSMIDQRVVDLMKRMMDFDASKRPSADEVLLEHCIVWRDELSDAPIEGLQEDLGKVSISAVTS